MVCNSAKLHFEYTALLAQHLFETFAVFLASSGAPARALSNAAQVFNAYKSMRMLLNDQYADLMVGCSFQPSFSPRDRLQPTSGAASAFALQAFA